MNIPTRNISNGVNKQKAKYLVDLITLVSFVIVAITGLLIFFFLPPGEGQRGVHSTLLGYGRHDWGAIHDWAGIVMIVAALAHVVFYWNVFVCTTKNFFKSSKEICEVKEENK
jgi:cytochrome b subunit of formate dehydrogenase